MQDDEAAEVVPDGSFASANAPESPTYVCMPRCKSLHSALVHIVSAVRYVGLFDSPDSVQSDLSGRVASERDVPHEFAIAATLRKTTLPNVARLGGMWRVRWCDIGERVL